MTNNLDNLSPEAIAAIKRGCEDSLAGRVTKMDFSEFADPFHCPHCGMECDTWFDRCLDADGKMATRCEHCGCDVDKAPNPKADVAPASGAHVQRVVGCELSNGEKP